MMQIVTSVRGIVVAKYLPRVPWVSGTISEIFMPNADYI